MGAFSSKKTIKIENPGAWKEGEYVRLKTRQSVSDQQAIRAALLERIPDIASISEQKLMKHALDAQVVILQRMIVEWRLFDDDGQEVELTPENVAELDGEYADFILTQMNKQSANAGEAMSQEQQQSFLGGQKELTGTSSK